MHDGSLPLVLSCEHGGNRVPARYAALFGGARRALGSHRGIDLGAADLARLLSRRQRAPLRAASVTRLLVDLNRSPHHRNLFSRYSRHLDRHGRRVVLERYYRPYREEIERRLARALAGGRRVLHLSVHSFTPRLRGVRRTADIGLLYDPRRHGEAALARRWQELLRQEAPELRVRRNYPYRGIDDGFIPYLRRRFGTDRYVGIEIEVNQKHAARGSAGRERAFRAVDASLRRLRRPDRGEETKCDGC